jgi:hypothetical protein
MSHQSGKPGVVDLQYEPCRHHRPIFLAQGVGQCEQELFLGLVVFIEDEVVEPARCEHRDERLLDGGARALNRGLEGVELAIDGFGPLRFDRAAGDDAHCNRWHRLLAGDQEQRSGVVHVGVEIWKFVTFSGRMPRGRRLAWSDGARLNAGEMRGVMGEAAGCPELAIADAIDPGFELAPHGFRDGWCDLRGDDRGVRYLGAGKPRRHVLPALGGRQPADMRGSDPCHAPLHVPVLPGVWLRSCA